MIDDNIAYRTIRQCEVSMMDDKSVRFVLMLNPEGGVQLETRRGEYRVLSILRKKGTEA